MAINVFDELPPSGVFVNESVLSPEFLPDVLPGREKQIEQLAMALRPFAVGRKGASVLIFGPPGTGKTSSAKSVLTQFKDFAQKAQVAYINCWQHYTQQSVLAEACRLMGLAVPRRGLATDEVRSDFFNHLQKHGIQLVLVLDEADRLFHKKEEALLYDISRATVPIMVVAITNTPDVFQRLDPRVKSSLSLQAIDFPKYNPLELKTILRERAGKAFRKSAWSEDVVGLCAAYAAKAGGDARVALDVLWKSGRQADRRGALMVQEQDVRAAMAEQDQLNASVAKRQAGANDIEQSILAALDGGPKYSSDLQKELDVPERTFRRHLEQLAQKRVVSVEDEQNVGSAGKRRLVKKV
ncbi:AAA family ATPase [Candidatus Micrarchaeota archaeon]|nr:AAA family ATPase [Candidatus Micrarchaeota archaeon]